MERLRTQSQHDGRSINETAIGALQRGLNHGQHPVETWWLVLGDLVETPPTWHLSLDDVAALRAHRAGTRDLTEELERTRGTL